MSYQPRFWFEQRDRTGGTVFDGPNPIAEIRELRLCNVVLRPSFPRKQPARHSSHEIRATTGESRQRTGDTTTSLSRLIGDSVPLPLYWQQYANHQHPERNAGSHGRLECVLNSHSKLSLEIESASRSREVRSRYLLDLAYSEGHDSYVFDIRCRLFVPDGKRWLVTHNPHHGELEFCNLWPDGAFVPANDEAKKYQACFVQSGDRTERIPHHHLETSDKHNIGMGGGDRFLWLLEDENPVVEIRSSEPVTAGLCAYMWDAHFAYRVCEDGADVELPAGSPYEAHFRLYAIGRAEGESVVSVATPRPAPDLETIPIYVDGLNTFTSPVIVPRRHSREGGNPGTDSEMVIPANVEDPAKSDVWPWEHEPEIPNVIEYALDRAEGHGDNSSVRITARRPTVGRWMATTLGPAFGEAPFEDGKRYRLSGFVKTRDLIGTARLGIRLHRTGVGDVFDIASYETYYGDESGFGTTDWKELHVVTPPIDPAPDRMHLILELDGTGTCWFGDLEFKRTA